MSLLSDATSLTIRDLDKKTYTFTLEFEYQLLGSLNKTVLLAQATVEYTTTAGENVLNFPASDFTGNTLDFDQDGISNLKEVISGVNPFGVGSLITSKNQFNVNENSINIGKVELIPATTEATFSYTLFGTDSVHVSIDNSGQLIFYEPPNYEQPADNNRDNIYEITVRIDDGSRTIDQPIMVAILDSHDLDLVYRVKQFLFTWESWPGASYYKLIQYSPAYPNGRQIGIDIYGTDAAIDIATHLHDWNNTEYILEAYDNNFERLSETMRISSLQGLQQSLGFLKADTPSTGAGFGSGIDITADGNTLVIGAPSGLSRI